MNNRAVYAVYVLILTAAAACAAIRPGVQTGCPADAVCGTLDFGARKVYLCASPSEWVGLRAEAAAAREAKNQ